MLVKRDRAPLEFVVVVDLHHVLTRIYRLYLIQILLKKFEKKNLVFVFQ